MSSRSTFSLRGHRLFSSSVLSSCGCPPNMCRLCRVSSESLPGRKQTGKGLLCGCSSPPCPLIARPPRASVRPLSIAFYSVRSLVSARKCGGLSLVRTVSDGSAASSTYIRGSDVYPLGLCAFGSRIVPPATESGTCSSLGRLDYRASCPRGSRLLHLSRSLPFQCFESHLEV